MSSRKDLDNGTLIRTGAPIYSVVIADGRKDDEGKVPLGLMSGKALIEVSKVLLHGEKKYGRHNWRKGIEWQRLLNAAMRHVVAFNDGEDKDEETGLSHIAHAICALMFLLEEEETRRDLDDRYKVGTKVDVDTVTVPAFSYSTTTTIVDTTNIPAAPVFIGVTKEME